MKFPQKILIVEDESIIAADIEAKLTDLGFSHIRIAYTVNSALNAVSTFQPDLILLDINLNDEIDGIELAKQIQHSKNIPLIFITAYSDESTLNRAIFANPLGYIIKPFTINELNTSINLAFYKYKMGKKLIESEKRYRELFETAQVGIVTVSTADNKIENCNSCFQKMMGFTQKADLIGKSIASLYEDPADHKKIDQTVRSSGYINHFQSCLVRAFDDTIWVEGSSWMNDNDNLIESVFIDITDRKRIEDKLRQSQKMETVGQIAAGMAHEINTPLAVINTRLQILRDEIEISRNPAAVKQIENINKNIYRMSGIIERLLNFSRTKEKKVLININEVLDEVLFFVTSRAKKGNINLILNFTPEPPLLLLYKNRIEQVFLNIVMNSFDAMSEGGNLKISTAVTNSDIRVIFADNGCGMSTESLQKIFDPFYTTKPLGKGTGLGMYISYGIVKEHDGDIILESKLDKGTKVTIILPFNQE
ncbi:MAG: hypothetical protein APR54_03095 [Candidatus Cloacimonas sp. SDB]|nr:MAG: hypothetical protein APR54_03095 [Candidatus Cloacimonas sp. SDB]